MAVSEWLRLAQERDWLRGIQPPSPSLQALKGTGVYTQTHTRSHAHTHTHARTPVHCSPICTWRGSPINSHRALMWNMIGMVVFLLRTCFVSMFIGFPNGQIIVMRARAKTSKQTRGTPYHPDTHTPNNVPSLTLEGGGI